MKIIVITLALLFFTSVISFAQSFHYDEILVSTNTPDSEFDLEQIVLSSTSEQEKTDVKQQTLTEASKSSFDKSKIEIGGSFGLTFGDYTSITIAPQIGYAFNSYFSAGGGISYNYYSYSYNYGYVKNKNSQNYLGLNLYGRLRPIRYIALQVQPEGYYMWGNYSTKSQSGQNYNTKETAFVPTLLVGGGAIVPAGRGGISMMIYYDIVQYKKDGINYSPYGNQMVYSVGYVFNF